MYCHVGVTPKKLFVCVSLVVFVFVVVVVVFVLFLCLFVFVRFFLLLFCNFCAESTPAIMIRIDRVQYLEKERKESMLSACTQGIDKTKTDINNKQHKNQNSTFALEQSVIKHYVLK